MLLFLFYAYNFDKTYIFQSIVNKLMTLIYYDVVASFPTSTHK